MGVIPAEMELIPCRRLFSGGRCIKASAVKQLIEQINLMYACGGAGCFAYFNAGGSGPDTTEVPDPDDVWCDVGSTFEVYHRGCRPITAPVRLCLCVYGEGVEVEAYVGGVLVDNVLASGGLSGGMAWSQGVNPTLIDPAVIPPDLADGNYSVEIRVISAGAPARYQIIKILSKQLEEADMPVRGWNTIHDPRTHPFRCLSEDSYMEGRQLTALTLQKIWCNLHEIMSTRPREALHLHKFRRTDDDGNLIRPSSTFSSVYLRAEGPYAICGLPWATQAKVTLCVRTYEEAVWVGVASDLVPAQDMDKNMVRVGVGVLRTLTFENIPIREGKLPTCIWVMIRSELGDEVNYSPVQAGPLDEPNLGIFQENNSFIGWNTEQNKICGRALIAEDNGEWVLPQDGQTGPLPTPVDPPSALYDLAVNYFSHPDVSQVGTAPTIYYLPPPRGGRIRTFRVGCIEIYSVYVGTQYDADIDPKLKRAWSNACELPSSTSITLACQRFALIQRCLTPQLVSRHAGQRWMEPTRLNEELFPTPIDEILITCFEQYGRWRFVHSSEEWKSVLRVTLCEDPRKDGIPNVSQICMQAFIHIVSQSPVPDNTSVVVEWRLRIGEGPGSVIATARDRCSAPHYKDQNLPETFYDVALAALAVVQDEPLPLNAPQPYPDWKWTVCQHAHNQMLTRPFEANKSFWKPAPELCGLLDDIASFPTMAFLEVRILPSGPTVDSVNIWLVAAGANACYGDRST